jgi:hypothetical protein
VRIHSSYPQFTCEIPVLYDSPAIFQSCPDLLSVRIAPLLVAKNPACYYLVFDKNEWLAALAFRHD